MSKAKLLLLAVCLWAAVGKAQTVPCEPPAKTREIYVPSSDLKVLLDSSPHRVLLTRQEYDELVEKAKKAPETHVPHPTVIVSSDYEITVDEGRAKLQGTIAIDSLEEGLHVVPLDFGGVGLLKARLDDRPAPMGCAPDGRLNLLVSGLGRRQLVLEMVAPVELNSAQQCLSFRVTNAPVGRWRLNVPGDVEIKGGADVISRKVEEPADGARKGAAAMKVTRFELLPRGGENTILMSLNSHLQRRQQAVAARCVLFDEVTEAYEKLHATVTLWVLHRAVDRFRFVVPEGFEIAEINSPLLARWDVQAEAGCKVVNVRLREQTADTVVLSVAAVKTPSQLKSWRMPRLELLDVVGQVTVLGLLAEQRLQVQSLAAADLIPVDTTVLASALPAALARPEPGTAALRPIAAYYAPQGGYQLTADFSREPSTFAVTTNLLLNIREKGCEAEGGFLLLPAAEKRFGFDFNVPAAWAVSEVTGPNRSPLAIERYASENGQGRVHVKLPQGMAPGQIYGVAFRARYTPPGWFRQWTSQSLEFPMFRVSGAERDEGAVAVAAEEDMEVRPDKLERLVPITTAEMARFGMTAGAMNLAYRYEGGGGKATIVVQRAKSRATARTFAFFQIVPEVLKAHYVVIYAIDDAKRRRLSFLLPDTTPESISIRGLEGVNVKEFTSEAAGTNRRWNVLLDEARRGEVRLEVDFEMRPQAARELDEAMAAVLESRDPAAPRPDPSGKVTELKDYALPLLMADAVVYQSGVTAIEGDLELGVEVKTDARRADLGQLAIARYTSASLEPYRSQPGATGVKQSAMRLLGTYEFVGDPPKVAVDVVRNPSYALTPAIIQRATLATLLSADGTSQTQAVFQLRAKVAYLEFKLPGEAVLWSAVLDGVPLKPQKRAGIRLIGLPPAASGAARNLQLVYEAPVQSLANGSRMSLAAPRLLYRVSATAKGATEIPLVNVQWTVTLPDGYEAVATDGTLEAKTIERPVPAPLAVADALYELGGGVHGPAFLLAAGETKAANRLKGIENAPSANGAKETLSRPSSVATCAPPASAGTPVPQGESFAAPLRRARVRYDTVPESPANQHEMVTEQSDVARSVVKSDEKSALVDERAGGTTPFQAPLTGVPSVPDAVTADAPSADADLYAPAKNPPAAAPPAGAFFAAGKPGSVQAPAPVPAPPEPKPEAAKPAETPFAGWGPRGEGGRPSSAIAKSAYQKGLSGFRSLKIDVQQGEADQGQLLSFSSLGAEPRIDITLARRSRNTVLVWGIALIVLLLGMAITNRPVRQKAALIVGLALVSAIVPLVWDTASTARICNGVFYAACLLAPYYLVAGLVRWIVLGLRGLVGRIAGPAPSQVAAALVLALGTLLSANVRAQPQPAGPEPPVAVPDDAMIVPYNAKSKTGIKDADHVLAPYDRYVELWNRAHPDKKIDAHPAPLPYALSGAIYSAVLEGEETLNISGQMQVDVLVDGYVAVPLGLRGGVLARADLDGKPARLNVVRAAPDVSRPNKSGKTAAAMDATLLSLQASGKGSHKLDLEIRLKLARVGGWRSAAGSLPVAPAAMVAFRVPQPQTEVRLGQSVDRRTVETTQPDETLETALGADGALQLQWRPKVTEGQVDRGLAVETAAVLDVREDGLRMAMHMELQFHRSQHDAFTLSLPAEYLVEKVAGSNIRGWEVRRDGGQQSVEVSLLKTAKDGEQFNLFLSRSGKVGQVPLDTFDVPMVAVRDAAIASGQLAVRRSPLLDVRTVDRSGATRIDPGPLPDLSGGPATDESVLAMRAFEAYHFPAMPFVLRLSAAPTIADVTAEAQTSVRLDAVAPSMESKIVFHVGQRRIYELEVGVPDELRLPEATLPSAGVWSIEKVGAPGVAGKSRSVLKIHLQQGVLGDAAVILRGKLGAWDGGGEISLPRLDVLGVKRQEGDIAVQADPDFAVQARQLQDCRETELARVSGWLDPQLRDATRLALHYAGAGYAGKLRLAPRTPEVSCDTVTNVRITDRSIEETIFLNYSIRNAGIHELAFLLPASMADARISTPMLRRKTIAPLDPKSPDSPVRVRLELQGDVMNDLRVLVQNDRLLTPESHAVPLPGLEAAVGRAADFVRRQYAVLETNNRDELVVETPVGLEALGRQQQQWQALSELLGTKRLYQAYLVEPGATAPSLKFHLQRHEEVETSGARIDLAETTIVVDAHGAYRAKVELSLDNSSEQFLDVELPEGATLWTVRVAGEPVKPARAFDARDDRHVLLPVRKTAKGDANYLVVLKYGGTMPPLSLASAVRFPLVHRVKSYPRQADIGIEQSQVQVYVPKSRQWFAFGGTMHRIEDEADLKAGRLAAFNKQGQRLIEATRDKDPFARLRAAENLKSWVAEARKSQEESKRGRSENKALRSQLSTNSITAQQANEALKSAGGKEQQDESEADNRQRLNDLYQNQITVSAGTLALTGANSYNGGTTVSSGKLAAANGGDFNVNWIARNGLGDLNNGQPRGGMGGMGEANGNGFAPPAQMPSQPPMPNLSFIPSNAPAQQANPADRWGLAQQQAVVRPNAAPQQVLDGRAAIRNDRRKELAEYQQRLSMAQGADQPQSQVDGESGQQAQGQARMGLAGSMKDAISATADADKKIVQSAGDLGKAVADKANLQSELAGEIAKQRDTLSDAKADDSSRSVPATAVPTAPAGLASLDFDLPVDKEAYELYRFATPLGQAELTARTVGNNTLARLEFLAAVAAACLVGWIIFRLIGRGALDWFRRPVGATLLLLAGLVAICGGLLPVVGLVAVVAGIVLLIAHFWRRRAMVV